MGFFQDNLVPFFKKRELAFIERRKESDDVYTFVFEKGRDLTWKAGQYGLFSITHTSIKNGTRPFSVSSAPTENVVSFTTRIGSQPSEFKRSLLELTQGMKLTMRGPVGPFYLRDISPTVLIAGGIGITPFRSMLKQLGASRNGVDHPIHLLYLDGDQDYLFKDELDASAGLHAVRVTYLRSREELNQEVEKFDASYMHNGKYYVAGPKPMAESIAKQLLDRGVSKRNMYKDAFFGY